MVKIIDLSVKLEDFMPSHKNLQRPFVKPHVTHEESKRRKLGTPEDPMTFTTMFMAMVDHTGTHVNAFYHNNPDGLPVDEMPLEMFMGKTRGPISATRKITTKVLLSAHEGQCENDTEVWRGRGAASSGGATP
jgi:kynurenine formamidase